MGFAWKLNLCTSALSYISAVEMGLTRNYLIPSESEEPDFFYTVFYLRHRDLHFERLCQLT